MNTQKPLSIRTNAYYSNGAYGRSWGVRQIVSVESGTVDAVLHFRGVAGVCRRKHGHCPLAEFLQWARYEVTLNENSWHRVGPEAPDAQG